MKSLNFGGFALGVCAALAMLAGCGGGSSLLRPTTAGPSCFDCTRQDIAALRMTTAERTHVRPAYGVIYSFQGGDDGASPFAGLLNLEGALYGTTEQGGGTGCFASLGCGTVFAITTSGGESVLHSFGGTGDGASPSADLINVKGTLYSTTGSGGGTGCGGDGCGTAFTITASGAETVLSRFNGNNGADPRAGFSHTDVTFYGTTAEGGGSGCYRRRGCGTVYSMAASGKKTVLYRFKGEKDGDGWSPNAGVVDIQNTLYGTTEFGGAHDCTGVPKKSGCGTVFAVTTSGKETVLHSFKGGKTDGEQPYSGLVVLNGTLYGTTEQGGAYSFGSPGGAQCTYSGCGTIFAITTSGKVTVLYSFGGYSGDGISPGATLIAVNGAFYGTTPYGGQYLYGTVFAVTTSGAETVLHSFGGYSGDGAVPWASLTDVDGTLYGTTTSGGASGKGTVYSLSP
ncbi:MAG TPA: choice-of-anchor tandem repeat GloVer-containing protein [Candidatus Cybelea sp.]|nr:choice-of-anchor tandem repeat GloVer-containing protein [Candidatus Cybelea sp.]